MTDLETLVILSPAFPESESEIWLPWQRSFIRCLNRDHPGIRVVVIAFRHPAGKARRFNWEGNTVMVAGNGGPGKLRSLQLWMRVWARLKELKRTGTRMGILSLFLDECALIGQLFARRHGILHKTWVLGQDALATNRKVARLAPRATDLIALSDFLCRTFEKNHGIRPAHVVPVGIDPLQFPAPAPKDIDLIAVGSLSALKRHDVFLRVVAAVAGTRPVRALICGGGSEFHALTERIRELGLTNSVTITGMLPNPQVLQLLQRSRVLLHTSTYEGFGLVCTEALYAGAGVISFTRPMDAPIVRWHHAEDEAGMTRLAIMLLDLDCPPEAVLPYPMSECCTRILGLYAT